MLKAIGFFTVLIILLGLLTGAINAIELWNTVRDVVLSIVEQLQRHLPAVGA